MIVSVVHKCVLTQYSTWLAQVLLLSMQILSKRNYEMLHPYHLLLIVQILITMSHNNSPKAIQISLADHISLWGILNVNLEINDRNINIFWQIWNFTILKWLTSTNSATSNFNSMLSPSCLISRHCRRWHSYHSRHFFLLLFLLFCNKYKTLLHLI